MASPQSPVRSEPSGAYPSWPFPDNPPWKLTDVFLIAVIALLAIAIATGVVLAVAYRLPSFHHVQMAAIGRDARMVVPAQFLGYLIVLAFMYYLVRLRYRQPSFWSGIRWNWPNTRLLAGYLSLGVILAFAIQVLASRLPEPPKQLPIDRLFRDATGAYMVSIFGITLAPLIEELFFRGFLYPALRRRLGMLVAVVLTALGFMLIHAPQLAESWSPMLVLFIVGLVLTWTRARTGSVAASFLIHITYNASLFLSLYLASDHFRHIERIS